MQSKRSDRTTKRGTIADVAARTQREMRLRPFYYYIDFFMRMSRLGRNEVQSNRIRRSRHRSDAVLDSTSARSQRLRLDTGPPLAR